MAGQIGPKKALLSPEAATNVTLLPAVWKILSSWVSLGNSLSPQLMDTTFPAVAAYWTPATRSLSCCVLSASTGTSTSTMFAPGAIECAHSTSSAVPIAQPES